jgi:peptidylprolyl isomerase
MRKAKKGNTVRIHFIGKTADDTVFSSSIPGEPLELVIGNSAELSAFQKWVIGMEEGEKRTITVPPEEAFGQRQNELVTAVNKSALPDNIVPTLGQLLQLKGAGGRIVDVRVIGITEDMVVLDANHPLSGHTLKFEIDMIEIK